MTKKMQLPKSKPTKPKATKTQDDFNREMGNALALLELRAELDPYLQKNPAARLGFDMIERGEVIGDDSRKGGEILAGLVGGEEGFDIYGIGKNFAGVMLPSSRYKKSVDPKDPRPLMGADEFKQAAPLVIKVLQKQGIESLLPSKEGSTVYYDTGDDTKPRGADLSILMEELAHLGMRKLQTDAGKFTDISLPEEERLMDYMQGRAEAESGAYSDPGNKDRYLMTKYSSKLGEIDAAALEELGKRGVPPQRQQVPPTMMEKFLELFR